MNYLVFIVFGNQLWWFWSCFRLVLLDEANTMSMKIFVSFKFYIIEAVLLLLLHIIFPFLSFILFYFLCREEYVLDEDDYELLEDNNVIAPRRKVVNTTHILSSLLNSKFNVIWRFLSCFFYPNFQGKFKRLKKAQRHAQGDVGGLSDEEEFLGSGKGGRTAEEKLKFTLFGDDEGISIYIYVEL